MKFRIPIKIISEANHGGHYITAYKRKKKHKMAVRIFLNPHTFPLPCTVYLTRVAPRSLDEHDNLPMSMKHIVDVISDILLPGLAAGRADDSKEITWQFNQRKGKPKEYALEIEIESHGR